MIGNTEVEETNTRSMKKAMIGDMKKEEAAGTGIDNLDGARLEKSLKITGRKGEGMTMTTAENKKEEEATRQKLSRDLFLQESLTLGTDQSHREMLRKGRLATTVHTHIIRRMDSHTYLLKRAKTNNSLFKH